MRDNGVLPASSALDPGRLTVETSWSEGVNQANAANSSDDFTSVLPNRVTVTVSYEWIPEAYLSSPIVFSSTSTVGMSY